MHPVGSAVVKGTSGKIACRMICKCSLALDLKCHPPLVNSMRCNSALRNHMARMPMFEAAWQTEAAIASKRLPDSALFISPQNPCFQKSQSPHITKTTSLASFLTSESLERKTLSKFPGSSPFYFPSTTFEVVACAV